MGREAAVYRPPLRPSQANRSCPRRTNRRGPSRLIVPRQQERRHAPVALGDDPEGIHPEALARLRGVDGVSREDTTAVVNGPVVGVPILAADMTPIARRVPREIALALLMGRGCQSARRGDDLAKVEAHAARDTNRSAHAAPPLALAADCVGATRLGR